MRRGRGGGGSGRGVGVRWFSLTFSVSWLWLVVFETNKVLFLVGSFNKHGTLPSRGLRLAIMCYDIHVLCLSWVSL
jgi:hypothetical protein